MSMFLNASEGAGPSESDWLDAVTLSADSGLAPSGLVLVPLQDLEDRLALLIKRPDLSAYEPEHSIPAPPTQQRPPPMPMPMTMPPTLSLVTLPPSPPHDERSVSPVSADSSSRASSSMQETRCRWGSCTRLFSDPEALYAHLCADHVGRKSTGNLCLTCKWTNCTISCAKRDHITSHLRVHTPLKPHICEVCSKSFKRPQDLKKHEKIHTEEHHAQHKHSKAITVTNTKYVQRVRRQPPHGDPINLLPTPSPEIDAAALEDIGLDMHQMNWTTPMAGNKRSRAEYAVDEFLSDVKKRCVQPEYNSHMIDRLNHMTHIPPPAPPPMPPSFNPTSISLDIRSEAELAAVNNFLLTLGRDVSNGFDVPGYGAGAPLDYTPGPSPDDYFTAASLHSLGLTGMPGLPDYAPLTPAYSTHASAQSYAPTTRPMPHSYPAMDDMSTYAPGIRTGASQMRHPHYAGANAALMSSGGGSPHSMQSTHPSPTSDGSYYGGLAMDTQQALAHPRGHRAPAPAVHLAPQQYAASAYRHHARLQTSRASQRPPSPPPEPVEPALKPSQERGLPMRLSSLTNDGPSLPAYPGLRDPALTLPPLGSSSSTRLPSIRSMVAGERPMAPPRRASFTQRTQHARLIRDLLVHINTEFRRRAYDDDADSDEEDGDASDPPTSSSGTASPSEREWTLSPRSQYEEVEHSPRRPYASLRDIEMAAA